MTLQSARAVHALQKEKFAMLKLLSLLASELVAMQSAVILIVSSIDNSLLFPIAILLVITQ